MAFTTTTTTLEELPDDVIGKILLFCDFASAIRFSQLLTRKSLQNHRPVQSETTSLRHVWREIYHRHGFEPLLLEEEEDAGSNNATDYVAQTIVRRRLLANLLQSTNKRKKTKKKRSQQQQCLNLPHRYFHFLPILPNPVLLDEDDDEMDPPPIFYECDSFVLTSTGTGSELVLLNPFDGTLSVLNNLQDYCVSSSDEEEMVDACLGKTTKIDNCKNDEFHGRRAQSKTEQCLLDSNEYFQFDIAPYFPNRENIQLTEEYELTFMGTDAKPILTTSGNAVIGSMVGVGRSVRNIQDVSVVCTELAAWTRIGGARRDYGNRVICRFPWTFHLVDMDAMNKRFFVSFHEGDGPLLGRRPERHSVRNAPSSRLVVYPMVEYCGQEESSSTSNFKYFPSPLFALECGESIANFGLDATGSTLIVATKGGKLQQWDVQSKQQAKLIQQIGVRDALRDSIEAHIKRNIDTDAGQTEYENLTAARAVTPRCSSNGSTSIQLLIDNDPVLSNDAARRLHQTNGSHAALCHQLEAARFRGPVNSIFLCKHASPAVRFVTLHRHPDEGSSLLLWQKNKIVTLINLPLSSGRIPRVYYEGSRLIVFGEDHIGMIILVYHVRLCDDLSTDNEPTTGGGEASGGVYNLTKPPVVYFANRIRHVALGGIDSFDSIHMTCNERFLIVNTRAGHLLGGSPLPEGLLVIDLLQDHDRHAGLE